MKTESVTCCTVVGTGTLRNVTVVVVAVQY
jgi:hypothetical protein